MSFSFFFFLLGWTPGADHHVDGPVCQCVCACVYICKRKEVEEEGGKKEYAQSADCCLTISNASFPPEPTAATGQQTFNVIVCVSLFFSVQTVTRSRYIP